MRAGPTANRVSDHARAVSALAKPITLEYIYQAAVSRTDAVIRGIGDTLSAHLGYDSVSEIHRASLSPPEDTLRVVTVRGGHLAILVGTTTDVDSAAAHVDNFLST